jgi:hypothetical protein
VNLHDLRAGTASRTCVSWIGHMISSGRLLTFIATAFIVIAIPVANKSLQTKNQELARASPAVVR